MFNGEGAIDNKLKTILGMAGDSQAIYEFMQNAVDAKSEHFLLSLIRHNDKPYLIVLNDGDYFSLLSVKSILAIGSSSKYRNPDNIGQFGVGFKLAHRLIGADDSIKELLDDNKGPILFSWKNADLGNLSTATDIEPVDPACSGWYDDAVSNSDDPWLFKIVATNFPCLIKDEVRDARGNLKSGLFFEEDWTVLKSAAKRCLHDLPESAKFKTGTLLVIPLHEAKIKNVIGEIPKGLEIAATILSKRAGRLNSLTTLINGEFLKAADLDAEHWELSETEAAGMFEKEGVKKAELIFLYSNPISRNPFLGKPQFYRYFPMASEQHGFRFAIHGNALSFSSARTELQNTESNCFLFEKLINLLTSQLKQYSESDPSRFERLYLSVLLSQKSENNDVWKEGREWLEDSLWKPLLNMLRTNVPIKNNGKWALTDSPASVVIKSSKMPLEDWYKNEPVKWFYWNATENIGLPLAIKEKLDLRTIRLLEVLLSAQNIPNINTWLAQSSVNADIFMAEFNLIQLEGNDKVIWENVSSLKLWWFGETNYSIKELEENKDLKFHLINYGP